MLQRRSNLYVAISVNQVDGAVRKVDVRLFSNFFNKNELLFFIS